MLSKPLKALVALVPDYQPRYLAVALNCLVALAVTMIAILLGHILQALTGQPHQPLGGYLPALGWPPAEATPLARVTRLLALVLSIVAVTQLLLYGSYRLVQHVVIDFELAIVRLLRNQALRLARVRTLSAQQTALLDCLEYHLPRVRNVLGLYWRSIPRHPVQCAACVLCASLIHLPFTGLAICAALLLWLVYQVLDRARRTHLPVLRENATQHRSGLVNLCLRGPLLEAVHDRQDIEERFSDRLELYRRDAVRSLSSSAWKIPLLGFGLAVLASLLILLMSIQLLKDTLQLPAAVTFVCCLATAAYSMRRLGQVRRDIKQIKNAAEELNQFLNLAVPQFDDSHLPSLTQLSKQAVLEHVTVQDSRGRKLLEDASVVFEVGTLVGVVASHWLEARALAELLIGLGRPTSGRMLLDGQLVTDLRADSLTRCAHWVASDGGVLTGSIIENLTPNGSPDVERALSCAHLRDLIVRLPDGPHTLITHDDDRFVGDEAFRIGIARAILRQASIVIVEEPEAGPDQAVQQETLEAIKQLVEPDRITVVLAQRLNTVRQCDRVIFIHQHRVQEIATHAELVQRNELYRHLTYLRFNPFQVDVLRQEA